jgi:four helix bundle protein
MSAMSSEISGGAQLAAWRSTAPKGHADGALGSSAAYLDIARASLRELEAIVELVALLGYLSKEELSAVEARRERCAKLVYGLLRKMSATG